VARFAHTLKEKSILTRGINASKICHLHHQYFSDRVGSSDRQTDIVSRAKKMTMNAVQKYRVNSPKVVHETIDGEVVVVNLDKGDYYSFLATGAEIWENLIQGKPSNLVVAEICDRYAGEPGHIENSIRAFLDQLQQEELIVTAASDSPPSQPSSDPAAENSAPQEKQPFEIPTLQKYTDMEELLALDPIHEVDDMGWPNVKQ